MIVLASAAFCFVPKTFERTAKQFLRTRVKRGKRFVRQRQGFKNIADIGENNLLLGEGTPRNTRRRNRMLVGFPGD